MAKLSIQDISQELKQKYLAQSPKCSFKVGDTLKIDRKLDNRRHVFEALCIAKHNNGASSTFTVLNTKSNIEDRFELTLYTYNPDLKYEVVSSIKKFKKSKLYYLRHVEGKKARVPQNYK
jgi:large subunit ribosomal protein L19